MHALYDGKATNAPSITKLAVHNFSCQAIQAAHMTVIGGPWVEEREDVCYGLTLLAESHVSVHVNRATGDFHIDLFSCKPFDNCVLLSVISQWLDIRELHMRTLDRGNLYIGPSARPTPPASAGTPPRLSGTPPASARVPHPAARTGYAREPAPTPEPKSEPADKPLAPRTQAAVDNAIKKRQKNRPPGTTNPNLICKVCGWHIFSKAHLEKCGHNHHFIIETPNGPTSKGRCKVLDCTAEIEVANSLDDAKPFRRKAVVPA